MGNLQALRYLPQSYDLKGDDTLVLDCVYDSTGRDYVTYGGESSDEEMCIIALLYTPAVSSADTVVVDRIENNVIFGGSGNKTCGCVEDVEVPPTTAIPPTSPLEVPIEAHAPKTSAIPRTSPP